MIGVASSDLSAEFYKLWAKMLPNEVKAVHSGSVTLERLIAGEPSEE